MKTRHSIPIAEVEDHCRDHQCPCDPDEQYTAAPGKRPMVTLTHQPITDKENQS